MPARETVNAFIALVEQAKYVEALEGYYTPDSTMAENQEPPRVGLAAHIASERAVMGAFKTLKTHPVSRVLIDGDLVMINWVFEFTAENGQKMIMDELALQRWDGDRIAAEQFYYDPAQRRLRD